MKLESIFFTVGLNAEQIRAATAGASRPVISRVVITPENHRPICKVCGRPVGKWSCWPGPSVRDGRR
jgi:hypothetical protein